MAQARNTRTIQDLIVKEASKAFASHKEPIDKKMGNKLTINIAASGSFVNKAHNPNLPITTEEVKRQVTEAYNTGAAMWHIHPRDPDTASVFLPVDKRLKVHKEWCDAVFSVAPDIITNVRANYVVPPKIVGSLVDRKSLLAENRMGPVVNPVAEFAPNNRYIEVGISLCHAAALGRGTNLLSFNNKAGIISDVRFFQSKGIRVELSPFKHSDLQDAKEWVIESRIAKPPVILDTLMGVHNSPNPKPGMEAFELLFSYVRMLPKGVLWQTLMGGRYWLPLTVAGIMLGADMVRIGMEDAVYMYPHRNDYIKSCGRVVETVTGIARYLGREVASPREARKMLGLPQIR
ncbi:MAG: 3-keto-5-aminohexanoate cleavage protein [Syntrophorhabdales bacterium]|jgi:3-keto-5-aminohexanoate cleavage enzyme